MRILAPEEHVHPVDEQTAHLLCQVALERQELLALSAVAPDLEEQRNEEWRKSGIEK